MKSARTFIRYTAVFLLAILLSLPLSAQEGETSEAPEIEVQTEALETPVPEPTPEPEEETAPLVTTPTFTLERDKSKETADGVLFYTDPLSGQVIITGYSGYLEELVIPSSINGGSVVAVAEDAFAQNTTLEMLTLPDSITTLGASFCEGCPNLHTIVLSSGITSIPESAFRSCEKLDTIMLPDSVVSIGDFAFEGCVRIRELAIPASLSEIGYDVFMGCERLIFDAGDNAYAIDYAKTNGIALGFTDTFLFHVILMFVLAAAIGIAGYVCLRVYRSGKRK
ncbi:MAG: leucine-rich repeat domain-containing protein [Clostridia bacterium]|nr:leucine-rich repeat domain-containing protein [Clostridia bacterium]MBQ4574530.1 leucine-rich repeat domain-containing protein [Clostridia bacterium]